MLKNFLTASAIMLFCVRNAHADPGLSSLEGLWMLYLGLGIIIFLLVGTGIFWGKITWNYVVRCESRFRWLKTYIVLAVAMTLISGFSAFTFHQNSPYSQNVYFLVICLFVIVVSVVAILKQCLKLKSDSKNT